MNREFERLGRLYQAGVIKPEDYFNGVYREYSKNGDSFSLEQVDLFEKQTKEVGLDWKPDISTEEGKIAGVLNQFASGMAEGFTTFGWADDPDTTIEGLSNKIGHLVGFAPDIVAGVLSFGASIPISAVKKSGVARGGVKAAQSWNKWLEKGAEQVPLLSSKNVHTGKVGLRSIPLKVADFIVDNSAKKLGDSKLIQTSFLTKGLARSDDFKAIAEESARLGVALAVSARKEGPEGWAEAAMHGAMAGAFFGGLGRYVYLGRLLGSGNKGMIKKAEKEIYNTAEDLQQALDDLAFQRAGKQSPKGDPLKFLDETEDILRTTAPGTIKTAPKFHSKLGRETGMFTEQQVMFATFMTKGILGASFTGGMATMQRAPLPDQVYEYLLGFFFGAASRPRGHAEATEWLLTKGYPELQKQAFNQYPLKPEIVKGKLVYKDAGFVDFDYKRIEGYEKLDAQARDYLERWHGNRLMDMFNKEVFPQALMRRIQDIQNNPRFAKEKEKRGELKFLQDQINQEVERWQKETAGEMEFRLGELLGEIENTDIREVKPTDYIDVFDMNGRPVTVEVLSRDKNNKVIVRDLDTGNAYTLDAKDSLFGTINYAHKDYVLEFNKTQKQFDPYRGRKIEDLTLQEIKDLQETILVSQREVEFLDTRSTRLLNALEIKKSKLESNANIKAKQENIEDLQTKNSLNKKDAKETEDLIDRTFFNVEQEIDSLFEALGPSHKAKEAIRNIARLEGNDSPERFWISVSHYAKRNLKEFSNPEGVISSTRDPKKPLNSYTVEKINKDGKTIKEIIEPRKILQQIYFKERAMFERKSYIVTVTGGFSNNKSKNWSIEWDIVPAENYLNNPLRVDATQSYWNRRMQNIYKDPSGRGGEFEKIISHEFILQGEFSNKAAESKVYELNSLSDVQSLYAINLMLAKQAPEQGGARYLSGFNPSNGELITIPYAQDIYKLDWLKPEDYTQISEILTDAKKRGVELAPEELKDLYKSKINNVEQGDAAKLMYERMRLSNFIYAAELAGYIKPENIKSVKDIQNAMKRYKENPLFPNVAKATKYIKTLYNGVPLDSQYYGNTTFFNGKGKKVAFENILNEEGGFNTVILQDHKRPYENTNGEIKKWDLTDGTKYYSRKVRERILLETGRISVDELLRARKNPKLYDRLIDGYIKDVMLVPENVEKDRGLLINKGAEDSATKAIYDLMDANGWDVMIYQSGAKSNSRHTVGKIDFDAKSGKWSVAETPEVFTAKPEDIRIIPHEVEIKKDGSAAIHWGLINKISDRMSGESLDAFNALFEKVNKGDEKYIRMLTSLVEKDAYRGLIEKAELDIDRLSMPFIYKMLRENPHSRLSKDILKNLFKSQNINELESIFGREGVQDIRSLNTWLEQIDYNPYGLVYGNKASMFNEALNNILVNKFSRPVIKRGFSSLRLKGYDPEIESMIKRFNKEGIKTDEFYLYNGDKTRDIEYRDQNGKIVVDTLNNVYKMWKKATGKFKKTLEEDMMYIITRSPQADEAGIATLKFGGFIDKPGRGIVVHKETAERLGGADYDGDMVAGYQSIDLSIKKEFMKPEFSEMHKKGNLQRELKNPEYDEQFGIEYASKNVEDVWDPGKRYKAGYQAIQGQKDIGLDVNATGRFRRIFDSIVKENMEGRDLQISPLGKKGTHFLRINPEYAKGRTNEEVWDNIRDERTTKQNNAFDALDYIGMKPSQQVSAESFFRYFQIIDAKGNPLKPLSDVNVKDYLNSILPTTFEGTLDYGPIFNPTKKSIQWKLNEKFGQNTAKEDKEGKIYRKGPQKVGFETLQYAIDLNPEQVFSKIKFKESSKGKLVENTINDVTVKELNRKYVEVDYTYLGKIESKKIPLNRLTEINYDHNYFRGLEVLAAADASFNGNKGRERQNQELYGQDKSHRMDVIEDAMAEMNQYFRADSAQSKIANNLKLMKEEVGSLKFELDIFKHNDLTNIFKNITNAYVNMKDTPLFKYLIDKKYIDPKSDAFMIAANEKGLSGAQRAGLILKTISLDAELNSRHTKLKVKDYKGRLVSLVEQGLYKDVLIANHIRRAEMLVSASEIVQQLEIRLQNQGVSPKDIYKLVGSMVEDVFVGKHILQSRYHTNRKQQKGDPYVDKFLKGQYEKYRTIRVESGKELQLDAPTQEVMKFLLHKMLLSDIVPGQKPKDFFREGVFETEGVEAGLVRKYGIETKTETIINEAGEPVDRQISDLRKQFNQSANKNLIPPKDLEKSIERLLSEGVDDITLDLAVEKMILDGLKQTEKNRIAFMFKRIKGISGESANLWNSQHIPNAHKVQIIKDITEFITAADAYGASAKKYVTEIFKVPVDKARVSLLETLKALEKNKKNNQAKQAVEESIQTDLVNVLSDLSRKKEYKKIKEQEKIEQEAEKEVLEKADKELKEDIELKTKDEDIYNEFSENIRKEINKEVFKKTHVEYGTGDFLMQIHNIYKEHGRPTAMAIAKRAIRQFYSNKDKQDLFALKKSKPLEMVEDLYDPTKPTVETPDMARELHKLETMIEKNPDLLITVEGLMAELSGQIGWTGVQNVAIPLQDSELMHMKAFNKFIEDMYIAKGSLLDKIKNKFKQFGKSDMDAEAFRKKIDEDKSPAEVKSIYHLLFNEFVGQKLRTHEMELYEKKNVPVFNKDGNPVITTRTLTLPTSTMEMVRMMVDQGKTLNTALSGFAEQHLKETFEFINANDNYLLGNFRDIFKAAIAIREYDPVTDKKSLHYGDGMYGGQKLDNQSKEYLRKEYFKAQDYLDSVRMKEGEIWPDAPENNGMRKFTIQDPNNPGEKKTVTVDQFVEITNNRITDFFTLFKDKFIMKNFRQDAAGEFTIRESIAAEVMGKDGFIDTNKISAKLDLTSRYSGANINRMLEQSVGLNELLWYQYQYGLKKSVQQELAEKLGIKPNEVDLFSKEAQELRDSLSRGKKAPMVNVLVDAQGNPSAYWARNGHGRYSANVEQLELYIQERLTKYGAELDSEKAVLNANNVHSSLYKAAQLLVNPEKSKLLAPYATWEGARAEMLKDRRATLERSLVSGQREDGGYSEGIAHMIQTKDAKSVFGYLNGSMKSRDELIMPGYDKSYEALTTYHKNFLKTYIDNVVGFRSHLLIDKFEAAEKLGEHTNAWSGYMRDALTNMLGLSTFRSLEIAGMKKKELPLLQEYIKADLDRSVFSGKLKYEEKLFLDKIDSMTSPDSWWISKEAKRLKDPEMLDDAIIAYRKARMKEFATEANVNKIKRYGTMYNVFSDEVVVNTIRKVEKSAGKLLGIEDFTFFKKTKGLSEDSKRMMLANQAKALSNFEGKWELLSLLSHPKTLITNMLGGGINIYSDVGLGTFIDATNEKAVLKAFKGAEYEIVKDGKIVKRKFRNMKDIEEWIESLGILDSMFTQEVGMNNDIIKFGNSAFVKEVTEEFTRRLNTEPEAKTNEGLYKEIKERTVREIAEKYKLFDQVVEFGGKWMQYSERKLRRTAFLAHYLNARNAFGNEMTRHMTFDNVALIEIAKRGVEGSQFMYHSAFRTNYSNTAMGRIMTRFHPYAWNSIKRRGDIYKYGVKYTDFIAGTAANEKFQRQFTSDLMSLALANIFIASIFEYALSPPMNWMQDMAGLVFGDSKERERAFFSQWPHPALAPLQIVTPPAARYVLPPVNSFLTGDWESFWKYQSWTYLPFGRALRDMTRIYDSPAMLPDFATGIPVHRMHEMRREAIAERKAEKEAELAAEQEVVEE